MMMTMVNPPPLMSSTVSQRNGWITTRTLKARADTNSMANGRASFKIVKKNGGDLKRFESLRIPLVSYAHGGKQVVRATTIMYD